VVAGWILKDQNFSQSDYQNFSQSDYQKIGQSDYQNFRQHLPKF
jgi:hypothetical protein